MTISSAIRKAGPFLGNGVTTSFPFTFKVFQIADLQVIKTSVAGVETVLTLNSDYSVTLNGDQNANPGGTVTYPLSASLLQTGEKLTVTGVLGELQGTHITNGGNFFANNIEDQMDYLTILIQQHAEKLARALLGSSSDQTNFSIGTALQRANRYLHFDGNGNAEFAVILSQTLSQSTFNAFLDAIFGLTFGYPNKVKALGFYSGSLPDDGLGQFTDTTTAILHGHYSFLAEPQVNYRGGDPIYGRAAFADFSNIIGSVNQDHFNSFQAYPILAYNGTITNLNGYFARGDFTGSGTAASWRGFFASQPTGTGNINNLYGFYCEDLGARASGNNYAFFSEGQTNKSLLGGPLQLGSPSTPATIQYNWTSGNLELTPRATFKVHVTTGPLLIGGTVESSAASVNNDSATGNLIITPRNTFHTIMAGPLLEVSGDIQSGGPVKLKSYTVAGVPAAASYTGAMIFVSNESGGSTPAFSDGTNWRRVADRAIIS